MSGRADSLQARRVPGSRWDGVHLSDSGGRGEHYLPVVERLPGSLRVPALHRPMSRELRRTPRRRQSVPFSVLAKAGRAGGWGAHSYLCRSRPLAACGTPHVPTIAYPEHISPALLVVGQDVEAGTTGYTLARPRRGPAEHLGTPRVPCPIGKLRERDNNGLRWRADDDRELLRRHDADWEPWQIFQAHPRCMSQALREIEGTRRSESGTG